MSTFIVSPKHIATICNAFTYNENYINIFLSWLDEIQKKALCSESVVSFEQKFINEVIEFKYSFSYYDNYKFLAKILVNANFESYNFRYSELPESDIDLYLSEVYKLSMRDNLEAKEIGYFQLIKFIHCLNYQACEHPDYENSFAQLFISIAEKHAIYSAPEYDSSEWAA